MGQERPAYDRPRQVVPRHCSPSTAAQGKPPGERTPSHSIMDLGYTAVVPLIVPRPPPLSREAQFQIFHVPVSAVPAMSGGFHPRTPSHSHISFPAGRRGIGRPDANPVSDALGLVRRPPRTTPTHAFGEKHLRELVLGSRPVSRFLAETATAASRAASLGGRRCRGW